MILVFLLLQIFANFRYIPCEIQFYKSSDVVWLGSFSRPVLVVFLSVLCNWQNIAKHFI